jgi:5-dehydro-2-deoxygluconokinase
MLGDRTATFDVLTMGRIGVDVYPSRSGCRCARSPASANLGGSPTNVAVAAARYGRRSAVITRTGQDPFGEYLHDALRGFGVDHRRAGPADPRMEDTKTSTRTVVGIAA